MKTATKSPTKVKNIRHNTVHLDLRMTGREAETFLSLLNEFRAAYEDDNEDETIEGMDIYYDVYNCLHNQTNHYILRMQDLINRRNWFARNPKAFAKYVKFLKEDKEKEAARFGECWDNWACKSKQYKHHTRESYIASEVKRCWRTWDGGEMNFLLGKTDKLPKRER